MQFIYIFHQVLIYIIIFFIREHLYIKPSTLITNTSGNLQPDITMKKRIGRFRSNATVDAASFVSISLISSCRTNLSGLSSTSKITTMGPVSYGLLDNYYLCNEEFFEMAFVNGSATDLVCKKVGLLEKGTSPGLRSCRQHFGIFEDMITR